ncbi:MAG TPA: hypothetical protein PLI22_04645 [Caldisericia bacterium]|nr:hypothetical protein [Caldisericia bacterium]
MDEIFRCPKCKSMNGSYDVSNQKFKCFDCKEKSDSEKFNFQEELNEKIEKDKEQIDLLKKIEKFSYGTTLNG